MRRQYHLPSVATGADVLSEAMSRQAGSQLVATVLAGIARGVRKAAPAEVDLPTGKPVADRTGRPGSGRYAVPGYDDGSGDPVSVQLVADDSEREAFKINEATLRGYPGLDDILRSSEMRRYFGLWDQYRRINPKANLRRFARLEWHQREVMERAYQQLEGFSDFDWKVLEERVVPGGMPGNWNEAAEHIDYFDRFVRIPARESARRAAASTAAAINAANARVSPSRESTAVARLAGLIDLYKAIRLYERLPSGAGAKEWASEFERNKRNAKDAMLRKLQAANFATVEEFDDAVRALRRVVRERAVSIALATMKRSEQILQAELQRYRQPGELNKLATDIRDMLRQPPPYENAILKLAGIYPILLDDVAVRGALAVRVPDVLGDVLRQNAQAQLGNITKCRATLREDPEHVFALNRVIDETLSQLELPPKSVQAVLIREGRAAPRSSVRAVIDLLLLVLSFAWGPLALVGYAARAASLVLQAHKSIERSRGDDRRRTGAHAGTPLADPPAPSGQWGEVLGLVLAIAGVLPGTPRTLLPGQTARNLFASPATSGGRVIGFKPGTVFVESASGSGKVAIVHPEHPTLAAILDENGLTLYSNATGVTQQVGHWPLSAVEAEVPSFWGAVVGTRAKALPAGGTPTPPPAVPTTSAIARTTPAASQATSAKSPPGAAPSGFGSLGAMARLSPHTQALDGWTRAFIQNLLTRTEQAAVRFRGFTSGTRREVLIKRADALAIRLHEYEQILTLGLTNVRAKRWTYPALDAEAREAMAWLQPKLYAAVDQVNRLERLTVPVPFPNTVEQALIDRYVQGLATLRDLHRRVLDGEAAALIPRNAVRDNLIAIEQRAARHAPGEESLLPHIEALAQARRSLLGSTRSNLPLVGERAAWEAATIARGGLANRTFDEIVAALGRQPDKIQLPASARKPGTTRDPLTGAAQLTWVFPDGSHIRIDVPYRGSGLRPFESGTEPHLARVGPGGVHYDDHGIVVPTGSTPAHIPITVRGPSDPLHAAIQRARR